MPTTTELLPVSMPLAAVVAVWLAAGLAFEALLARRQWSFLAGGKDNTTSPVAADREAQRQRIRYGQMRALFGWLDRFEAVGRVALWVAFGTIGFIYAFVAVLGLPGSVLLFGLVALGDHGLRQMLVWARWQAIDRRFGASHTSAGVLAKDELRRAGVRVAGALLAGAGLLLPFVYLPSIAAWPASALVLVAGWLARDWARTHLVAPLFNRFQPLPAGELHSRLTAMTERCGVRLKSVLVVDQSRRSRLANAYFTGLGRSKRIVLFDTLIERLEAVELEAVMAHELGHDYCGHIQRYYALVGGLTLVAFAGGGLAVSTVAPTMSPAVAILAIYFVLPALAWPLTPWLSLLRRRYEYEADAFAAEHASREGLISALEKLLAQNLGAPPMERWYAGFYATHPPGAARLARLRAAPRVGGPERAHCVWS